MSRFQILSLAGGGIRGAFVTSFLKELEQKAGRNIAEAFDLIAGTSTGGIIAAGLAMGLSAERMHDFYVQYGAKIFTPRPRYKARGVTRALFPPANWVFRKRTGGGLDAAFRARFCPIALREAFDEGFGETRLDSVCYTRLAIPAVNLTLGEPHVFRSCHLPKAYHDRHIKVTDVTIAATAAPTYFPHHQIGEHAYVDGAMWANDPSVLALAEAIRIHNFQNEKNESTDDSYFIDNIHLLSIGTGRAQFSLSPPGADAGLLYWAPRVADVMGTSQVQGIHLPLKYFLGDRYRHINFRMMDKWGLDEVEHIPELFQVGEQRAADRFESINDDFLQHTRVKFTPVTSTEGEITLEEFGFE